MNIFDKLTCSLQPQSCPVSTPLDLLAAAATRAARQAALEEAHVAGKIPLPPSPTAGKGEDTLDFASMVRLIDYYAVSPLAWFLEHQLYLRCEPRHAVLKLR